MKFDINKIVESGKFKKVFTISLAVIVILFSIFIIVFSMLGNKTRIGYLTDFKLNIGRTLELNNLENVRANFIIDNKLDEENLSNYLLTNENITNFVYHFRIRYYDKIFRNNDIYGVYPDLYNLPYYMKNVKMDKAGSPYGNFISGKKEIEEEKIDNVNYTLKIKSNICKLLISILLIIFIVVYYNEIKRFLYKCRVLYDEKLKEYKLIKFLNNNSDKLFIILYAYISFPIISNIFIYSGLDSSWIYFINEVVHSNFKFGRDIIFTYGHLGYLINPLNIGNNILFSFIFKLSVYIINIVSVYYLIKRYTNFDIFKIFIIIPLLVYFNAYIMYGLFDYYISFTLVLLLYLDIKIDNLYLYIIFCILISIAFFIKMGTAILNIAMIFVYLIYSLFFINKKFFVKRAIISLFLPILIFIIYYIYNPSIKDLFLFIKGSLEISSGYIYAMSAGHNNYIFVVIGAYIFALIYAILLIYYFVKKYSNFSIMLIISPLFYITYKHAFVRHAWIFVYPFSFIIFILLLNLINKKTKLKDFLIVSFIIVVILYMVNPIQIGKFLIFNKVKDISKTLNIVFNYKNMNSYSDTLKELPKEMLNEIADNTVTIYPWEISYKANNNINFIPMPIFQAYSSYTPYLDNLNADFFDNDNSPEYIILEWQNIDGRLPFTDNPKTFRNIYNNYYVYNVYRLQYFLLKKRDNKLENSIISNFTKNINIKNETIYLEDINDLKTDNMVVIRADIKLNLLGKISKLIYQIPEVICNVETEKGNKYSFRILLEQLNNGMLINIIPTDLIELKYFFDDFERVDKVKSINFSGRGLWLYKSNIDFIFDIYLIK